MTKRMLAAAATVLIMTAPAPAQTVMTGQDVVLGEPEILGALHLVVALHEFCRTQIPVQAVDAIGHDARRIEERMGLSQAESEASYQAALATTKELSPDCDRESLNDALGSYAIGISPFGGL